MALDAIPRWCSGTRSATTAVSPAVIAESPSWAKDHQAARATQSVWAPVPSSPTTNSTAPTTMTRRRRPKALRVRSESAPKTGSATSATPAEARLRIAKSRTLEPGSISASCSGRSSWSGTRLAAQKPSQARLKRVTHRRETSVWVPGSARTPGVPGRPGVPGCTGLVTGTRAPRRGRSRTTSTTASPATR